MSDLDYTKTFHYLRHFWKVTKNTWTTTNTLRIRYIWPRSTSGFVLNAIITEFISYYNPIMHQMLGAGEIMDHCKVDSGNCISRLSRIIWTPSAQIKCPKYDFLSDDNVFIHYDDKHCIHHVEIPKLDMAIHHLMPCDSQIEKCFNPPTFCDPGKLLIQPSNCSDLRQFISFTRPTRSKTRSGSNSKSISSNVERTLWQRKQYI